MDTERAAVTRRGFALTEARGVGRSLMRQSVLVAAACVVVDAGKIVLSLCEPVTALQLIYLVLVIAVDAALAMPARWSGWVAAAQVGVHFFAIFASPFGPRWKNPPAGELIAAYRAGAWLRGWPAFASLAVLAIGSIDMRDGFVRLSVALGLDVMSSAALPWLVGRYTTARRAHIEELRRRRENAAIEVEKAVARERTAIARDLHDVISHHVSAIGVLAGAARMELRAAGVHDAGVTELLSDVEASSRTAMTDLRSLLDLLHGASDSVAQPGLDNLGELFEGVRRSGLVTRLRVHGQPRPVPGFLDIALYRITQELLTNALRHGDGSPVDVELDYGESSITLAARNGIPPVPAESSSTARGLAGIRTRAAMFHGEVRFGPEPGNGRWATIVTVPLANPAEAS